MKETVLIIGAGGQIGTELTGALRNRHGASRVIATDVRGGKLEGGIEEKLYVGVDMRLDAMDRKALHEIVRKNKVTQIYLLAAMLSATGEQYPERAWDLNMQSLLNVLEVAREEKVGKIFWPSSIAVFGPSAPKFNCPQDAVQQPTTIYGISKMAGEQWCAWYHRKYGIDIRSIRYPGLISYTAPPGGGTTDYAVDIFHQAIAHADYACFLSEATMLPMLYMPDAIRGTLELMEAPAENIRIRTAYNTGGMSFSPRQLAAAISLHLPEFTSRYLPDHRQAIADSWPASLNDDPARKDWRWEPAYDLEAMTRDMLWHLRQRQPVPTTNVN